MAQGTIKDNARNELDEAAGRGRRDREDRTEATPQEVKQPGSGGVKDNVKDEWASRNSAASRDSQSAKPGPGS